MSHDRLIISCLECCHGLHKSIASVSITTLIYLMCLVLTSLLLPAHSLHPLTSIHLLTRAICIIFNAPSSIPMWFTLMLLHGNPTWSWQAEFFTLHPVHPQCFIEGPISAFISICILVMYLEPLDYKSLWAQGWSNLFLCLIVSPNKHPGPNNLMNEVSEWNP